VVHRYWFQKLKTGLRDPLEYSAICRQAQQYGQDFLHRGKAHLNKQHQKYTAVTCAYNGLILLVAEVLKLPDEVLIQHLCEC
jgi:hypothetical protein